MLLFASNRSSRSHELSRFKQMLCKSRDGGGYLCGGLHVRIMGASWNDSGIVNINPFLGELDIRLRQKIGIIVSPQDPSFSGNSLWGRDGLMRGCIGCVIITHRVAGAGFRVSCLQLCLVIWSEGA